MKNRTLNRPMFRRGGKVDSRGTGITSGLMPKRGFVDGPDGYAGKKSKVEYNVMGVDQNPEAGTTITGGGVGFDNSPFKKYVENPVQYLANTAISPIGNTISDIANYSKLFFGGKPTSNYFSPIYGEQTYEQNKSILNPDKQGDTILEKIGPSYTTTDVPEAETNENVNVSMDPKPEPDVENTNQDSITLDDLNLIEEEISSQSDMFEKLLAGDRKDDIFRALTKAAPKLLDEDYGGAIETAGEALDRGDSKQKAKELALKQYLDGKDLGETGKTIKAIQSLDPNLKPNEILSKLFDKVQPSVPIETIRAEISNKYDPKTEHEIANPDGYIEFMAQTTQHPDLQLVKYEQVKEGKGFRMGNLIPGVVSFDPTTKKYLIFDGKDVIEYSNYNEAKNNLK